MFEARLTILRADGTVIGDSWANPEEMENHLNRPEIERARVDGNLQLRYSDTIGQDLLYFAIPIEQDEELFGYARVGLSVESLNQMNRTVWIVVTASFFWHFLLFYC